LIRERERTDNNEEEVINQRRDPGKEESKIESYSRGYIMIS
jgi:hypothetical protein